MPNKPTFFRDAAGTWTKHDATNTIDPATIATGTFQPLDAELTAIAGLTSAADKLPYFTGSGTAALTDLSSFIRTLLDDANAAAARATLELTIGTHVQAFDAELAAIAGLTSAADKGIMFTGSGTAGTYDLTAAGLALLDDANAAAQLVTLGLSATATELNYTDGVTSPIQDQLEAKLSSSQTMDNTSGGTIEPGAPVYLTDDLEIAKARANSTTTAEAVGLAGESIADTDPGAVVLFGPLTLTTGEWDTITGDTGGLVAGKRYFVSAATAGRLVKEGAVTTTAGQQQVQMGRALSDVTMWVAPEAPILM